MKTLIKQFAFIATFSITLTFSYAQGSQSTSSSTSWKQPQTPIAMNDYFVSITDSLYQYGTAWGTKFSEVSTSKKFYDLTPHRKRIEQFINSKYTQVSELKDVNGSDKLKYAMLDFLTFEKKMITENFIPFEKISGSASDDDVKKALEKLTTASKDEDIFLSKVRETQEEYAKKNSFTIEKAKD